MILCSQIVFGSKNQECYAILIAADYIILCMHAHKRTLTHNTQFSASSSLNHYHFWMFTDAASSGCIVMCGWLIACLLYPRTENQEEENWWRSSLDKERVVVLVVSIMRTRSTYAACHNSAGIVSRNATYKWRPNVCIQECHDRAIDRGVRFYCRTGWEPGMRTTRRILLNEKWTKRIVLKILWPRCGRGSGFLLSYARDPNTCLFRDRSITNVSPKTLICFVLCWKIRQHQSFMGARLQSATGRSSQDQTSVVCAKS